MRNQNGFTLIELVVVIVILGILAAVAVPKFVDMQVDARASAVNGMLGAVRSANSLAHAQYLVKGGGPVVMEGDTITMANGYPTADATGIWAAVNSDGFNFEDAATATDPAYLNLGTAPDADCRVEYTAATISGTVVTPPLIAVQDACL